MRSLAKKNMPRRIDSTRGMTLVELLVSMAIALMVFALVGMVFLDMKKYMLRQEIQVAMIQNARIGLDEMARLIRMAGYNCDAENGQVTLIEAAPFQLTFNADTDPDHDVFPPKAMLPLYDNPNDYVSPDAQFTTGAETIRFTLDSTDDGDVDKRDIGDDTFGERDSPNPDDMSLIKEINDFVYHGGSAADRALRAHRRHGEPD